MATNPTITFETKCWEKDWKYLLKTNLLKKSIDRNNYLFEKKVLMINNISNYTTVTKAADKLIKNGTLTDYFFVDDYAEKTLNFFNLTKEDLGSGYYYSILLTNDGKIYFEKNDGSATIQTILTTNSQTTGSIELTGPVTASAFSGDGGGITNITDPNSVVFSIVFGS